MKRRFTFGKKMAILMICAVVIPVAVIIFITYYNLSQETARNYLDTSRRTLHSVSSRLDDYVKQLETLSMFAYTEPDLSKSDWEYHDNILSNLLMISTQKSELHSLLYYFPSSAELYVVDQIGNRSYYNADQIEQTAWYKSVTGGNGQYAFHPMALLEGYDPRYQLDGNTPVVSFVRRFVAWTGETSVLCMNVKSGFFRELCETAKLYEDEAVAYLTPGGEAIYTSGISQEAVRDICRYVLDRKTDEGGGQFQYEDDTICYAVSGVNGNILLKRIPSHILTGYATSMRNAGLLMLAVVVFVMIPILSGLSSRFTRPLRRLERQMEVAGKGDFTQKVPVQSQDEIGHITATFNRMLDEIETLVNERYKIELDNRTAQLNSLLAQINPHFLNNTLQTIGSVALEQGLPDVYRSTNSLSKMLRYSIKGNYIVTIREERKNVEDYLYIQKFRFGDKLDFMMDIPEQALDIKIPKLTLQPLVENAVVHGLERKKERGMVRLCCRLKQECVVLSISDNGIGMHPETLSELRESLEDGREMRKDNGQSGIGVVNVYKRLHLMYGNRAALVVESEHGIGTTVTVSIPLEKEESHV